MPRIEPLETVPDALSATGGASNPMGQLNIFRTLSKHPKIFEAFGRLGGFLLSGKGLPARERELVILRTGWRSGSVYEWGQHVIIGKREGVTDEEITLLRTPGLEGWSDADRPLVAFADELCQTNNVSDATWAPLAARFSDEQLIELVILGGFYRLVAGALNTLGVELDEGVPGWEAGS